MNYEYKTYRHIFDYIYILYNIFIYLYIVCIYPYIYIERMNICSV